MLKTEMEYLLETAAAIVNRIQYILSKDMVHVCPADTLFVGPKWDYLPVVKSKLLSINDMVSNLHKEEMEKVRNVHLIYELEEAIMKTKKQGRISGKIKPEIGDLVPIRSEKKTDYDKYGVITSIPTPQTIEISTRNGTVIRPWSITIPISPKCIIGDGFTEHDQNKV